MHNQKKAVSIRYNEEHVAPEISDKAAGLDAEELIRLAQEAGIYIHKDPVLLSYLDSLPEGASIPRGLNCNRSKNMKPRRCTVHTKHPARHPGLLQLKMIR